MMRGRKALNAYIFPQVVQFLLKRIDGCSIHNIVDMEADYIRSNKRGKYESGVAITMEWTKSDIDRTAFWWKSS